MIKQKAEQDREWDVCPECGGERHHEVSVVEDGEEVNYLASCETCKGSGVVPSEVNDG
jgi:DnaJ-class molecular chaperone